MARRTPEFYEEISDEALSAYLRRIVNIPLLTKAEELRLAKQIQGRGGEAPGGGRGAEGEGTGQKAKPAAGGGGRVVADQQAAGLARGDSESGGGAGGPLRQRGRGPRPGWGGGRGA